MEDWAHAAGDMLVNEGQYDGHFCHWQLDAAPTYLVLRYSVFHLPSNFGVKLFEAEGPKLSTPGPSSRVSGKTEAIVAYPLALLSPRYLRNSRYCDVEMPAVVDGGVDGTVYVLNSFSLGFTEEGRRLFCSSRSKRALHFPLASSRIGSAKGRQTRGVAHKKQRGVGPAHCVHGANDTFVAGRRPLFRHLSNDTPSGRRHCASRTLTQNEMQRSCRCGCFRLWLLGRAR